MTEQATAAAPVRRKTEQALKVSATWTPNEHASAAIRAKIFGVKSPLHVRGGRMTINAAIAIDMTDPAQAARVAARVAELKGELEAMGTLHTITTQMGAVPIGEAEHLPSPEASAA